jgi:hypothetical protein
MAKELANHEIVTLAVFLTGGDSKAVDTEDVAVKANELAPGRFTWRKHKDQINIEIVRAFLSDAKKPKYGALLTGAGKDGWMLSAAGMQFVRQRAGETKRSDLARIRRSKSEQNWLRSERERMLNSAAFTKYRAGELERVSEQEAEAFFRLDSYVTGKARDQKLLRLLNVFGNDAELGEAVNALEMKVRRN